MGGRLPIFGLYIPTYILSSSSVSTKRLGTGFGPLRRNFVMENDKLRLGGLAILSLSPLKSFLLNSSSLSVCVTVCVFLRFVDNLARATVVHSIRGHPFMTSTRRGRGQAQVDACGRGGGGPAPCGRPHRKLKLESTDVILSSSHAKKLASF